MNETMLWLRATYVKQTIPLKKLMEKLRIACHKAIKKCTMVNLKIKFNCSAAYKDFMIVK